MVRLHYILALLLGAPLAAQIYNPQQGATVTGNAVVMNNASGNCSWTLQPTSGSCTSVVTNQPADSGQPLTTTSTNTESNKTYDNTNVFTTWINSTAIDFQILTGPTSSGVPNWTSTTTGSLALPLNCSTTNCIFMLNGKICKVSTNTSTTLPSAAGFNWAFIKEDCTLGNTAIVPVAARTAPSLNGAASGSNPQYWFNSTTGLWSVNTAGSFGVASLQILPWAKAHVDGATNIDAVGHYPLQTSWNSWIALFGDGVDGALSLSSGSTNIDGVTSRTQFDITGTTTAVVPTATAVQTTGLVISSQDPFICMCSSANCGPSAVGSGRGSASAGTGAGAAGQTGGLGGGGGGGGASGTVAANGGAGAAHNQPGAITINSATANGATTAPAACQVGVNAWTLSGNGGNPPPYPDIGGAGSSGGNGGGDGTNNGGKGGAGGQSMRIRAPGVTLQSSCHIDCSGAAGANGAGGNAAGGGGGGSGAQCKVETPGKNTSGVTTGTSLLANGGAAGTSQGTGTAACAGGTGLAINTYINGIR